MAMGSEPADWLAMKGHVYQMNQFHIEKMEMSAFLTRKKYSNLLVPIKAMVIPK
jgi:hypothetical protein